jgi:ribosomal protein S28E/S33
MRMPAWKVVVFALAMGLTTSFAAPATDRDRLREYPVQKKEDIQKTLKFADTTKPGEVIVDNVFGPIKVEGYAGTDVLLVAHKTVYAKTEDKAARAQEEVKLDIQEKGQTVDIYVDGPFRENDRMRHPIFHSWRDPGYQVHYAFELKVPFKTDVAVSTVTDGDVEVRTVEGEFDVHNVNGKVRLSDVAGSGEAETVNGELFVGFRSVPNGRCAFKTVNGDLVLTLPSDVSADFRLKTFNGDVYSDFPVTSLPARPPVRDESKGKFIYKSDRSFGVRAGKGGPEIALDTLNGDILIKKKTA